MFKKSRLSITVLILISVSLITYTTSQAVYYNETYKTDYGREGTVYDYTIAEKGGATAYASVSKSFKRKTVEQTIYYPTDCPVSSTITCFGCSACSRRRAIIFIRKWGTYLATFAFVSCPQKTDGKNSEGSWSLISSEHQQPQIWGSVSGKTYEQHYKKRYHEFAKPDDLTGRAKGRITPKPMPLKRENPWKAETVFVKF